MQDPGQQGRQQAVVAKGFKGVHHRQGHQATANGQGHRNKEDKFTASSEVRCHDCNSSEH